MNQYDIFVIACALNLINKSDRNKNIKHDPQDFTRFNLTKLDHLRKYE